MKAFLSRIGERLGFGPSAAEVFTDIQSFRAYSRLMRENRPAHERQRAYEQGLLTGEETFHVRGFCQVCRAPQSFLVDFQSAYPVEGRLTPNWRERLLCEGCGLNNRVRAALHVLHRYCSPAGGSRIYITEQTTPLFRWLSGRFPQVTGSEFLGDRVRPGSCDANGLRNEDFTRLSFADASMDFVLSFDVLEHVPGYRKALAEAHRCLRPGGRLLLSAPFRPDSSANVVRARVTEDGSIEHLLEPEYHGDPISAEGCLCFYHFGWELLDDLRKAGFNDATAVFYWSETFAYLGPNQVLFFARKSS